MATYIAPQTITNMTFAYNATTFRTWVASIRAALSGVGLVQTSDTGQLNPATVTQASVNSLAGYEIWRFSDAAQATDPVFLKFLYYHGNFSSSWRLHIEVGQGSNGSGTLTGVTSSTFNLSSIATSSSGSGTASIFAFFNDGIFWIADGAVSTAVTYADAPRNFVLVARTRDTSGSLDGRGVVVFLPNGSPISSEGSVNRIQLVRRSPTTYVSAGSSQYGCMVSSPSSPLAAGSSDELAWPILYYDMGVGVVQLQACFASLRANAPSSPTAFDANPFGLGTRRWIVWQQGPIPDHKTETTYHTYPVLNLPWDV